MKNYLTEKEKLNHPYYKIMELKDEALVKKLNSWSRPELIDWLCFIFPKFKNYIYTRFGFWGRLQVEFTFNCRVAIVFLACFLIKVLRFLLYLVKTTINEAINIINNCILFNFLRPGTKGIRFLKKTTGRL